MDDFFGSLRRFFKASKPRILQFAPYASVSTAVLVILAGLFWFSNRYFFDKSVEAEHRGIVSEKLAVTANATTEEFDGSGFTPEGPLGTEPNIPPGYKDRDYQKADYSRMTDPEYISHKVNLLSLSKNEQQKNIQNSAATIEVSNVKETLVKLRAQVLQAGGFIEKEGVQQDETGKFIANITIRVKAENSAKFVGGLEAFGNIKSLHVTTVDVTANYKDMKLRLDNQLKLRSTIIRILESKTGSVKEVIEGTKELNDVTESLESIQKSMKGIEDRVAYSTISLQIHEPRAILSSRTESIWQKLLSSLVGAGYLFIDFLGLLIKSLGIILPISIIFFLMYRRRMKKQIVGKKSQKI